MAVAKLNRGDALRLILMAVFIVGGLLALTMGDIQVVRRWSAQWGAWAWLAFTLAGTVLLAVGFPRLALSTIAGSLFGIFHGTLLAEAVTTLAAIPPFYYTMFLGRDMVARRLGGRMARLNGLLQQHGFMVILLIRLCPVGNAFVVNCLAGLSAVRFRAYLAASAIGFLPMTFIFALLGAGLVEKSNLRLWCSIGLLAALTGVFWWYFKHSSLARDVMAVMRESKKNNEESPAGVQIEGIKNGLDQ